LVALAFLAAGGAKLAGVQAMIDIFNVIGLGQGFRYVCAKNVGIRVSMLAMLYQR
jgi:hypothetical protein